MPSLGRSKEGELTEDSVIRKYVITVADRKKITMPLCAAMFLRTKLSETARSMKLLIAGTEKCSEKRRE